MELQRVPIRRAGNRENLFLGGDRELVFFTGLLCFALIFATQDWKSAIIGVCIWLFSLHFLRKAAKKDPKLRFVYLRHVISYKRYYPAHSTPYRINKRKYK